MLLAMPICDHFFFNFIFFFYLCNVWMYRNFRMLAAFLLTNFVFDREHEHFEDLSFDLPALKTNKSPNIPKPFSRIDLSRMGPSTRAKCHGEVKSMCTSNKVPFTFCLLWAPLIPLTYTGQTKPQTVLRLCLPFAVHRLIFDTVCVFWRTLALLGDSITANDAECKRLLGH